MRFGSLPIPYPQDIPTERSGPQCLAWLFFSVNSRTFKVQWWGATGSILTSGLSTVHHRQRVSMKPDHGVNHLFVPSVSLFQTSTFPSSEYPFNCTNEAFCTGVSLSQPNADPVI